MSHKNNKAVLATICIKNLDEDTNTNSAVGRFIEEFDFFEKEKRVMMTQFHLGNIADDLRVFNRREELI